MIVRMFAQWLPVTQMLRSRDRQEDQVRSAFFEAFAQTLACWAQLQRLQLPTTARRS